jgi:hypothetical protein
MSGVPALFAKQAADCDELGSPFTARLLRALIGVLDQNTALGRRVLNHPAAPEDALPLRLAGGLHALARAGAVYPPRDTSDAALIAALAQVIATRGHTLLPWLDSPPQTNEVARSAVLIAVGHWLTARYGLPLHLSELGASAGLNLLWDHYALSLPGLHLGPVDAALTLTPDWRGPLPPQATPTILSRAGVDLSPLDPVADRDRLLAYVWADQTVRADRCRAALTLAARLHPQVTRGDAAGWLEQRLAQPRDGLHLVFHTVAAKYFPAATTARVAAAFAKAGARATADHPLAHLSMEYDGPAPDSGPGAALTLTLWPGTLWPGGKVIALGRADFHGRWVDWQAPQP